MRLRRICENLLLENTVDLKLFLQCIDEEERALDKYTCTSSEVLGAAMIAEGGGSLMYPKRCRTQRCFTPCRKEVRIEKVGKEEGGRGRDKEERKRGEWHGGRECPCVKVAES